MATFREWLVRLWAMVRAGRRDDDLEQELRAHLELAAEAQRGHAAGGDEQTGRAGLRWGTTTSAMDALRDQRGVPWLDDLSRDMRYQLRILRRNPTFAAVVLLTLALGIGATTSTFSLVNSVLLEPLPYPDPNELVAVWHSAPGAPGLADVSGDLRLSASMYFTYAEHNRVFEHFGVWTMGTASVTGAGEPEQVSSLIVTDGTLQALRVQPALGRWLTANDQAPGASPVVMLGYGYWQRRFGGDPSIVGRSIIVNARSSEIVGVMPRGFRMLDADTDLIGPLAFNRNRVLLPGFAYEAIARLKPGVTIAEANADIARLIPVWMKSWPAAPGVDSRVYENWRMAPAIRPLKDDVVGNVASVLWILMGTVGIVLLVVCANVANLLLVRAEVRHHELAVRAALGAGRSRIVRGLLIESITLGVVGGALGTAVAFGALRLLQASDPEYLPRLAEIAIDARVLGFAAAISLASGVLFGLMPALRYAGAHVSDGLRTAARAVTQSRQRLHARHALIVVQIAFALVLLVSAGLMVRTLQSLHTVDPGFSDPARLQTMRISIPTTLVPDLDRLARLQRDLIDRLSAIPGVSSVALTTAMHLEGLYTNWDVIEPEGATYGATEMPPLRIFKAVSPGFFETTGTRIVAGRDYTWTDMEQMRRFVIVSENLARELWGTPDNAIGKRLRTLLSAPWQEVIGVVQNVHDNGMHEPAPAIVYWPVHGESYYRAGQRSFTRAAAFVLRSERAGTEALLADIGRAVWSVNASLPLASPRTVQDLYDRSLARTSFTLVMLVTAAAMALVLGLVGIYGVVAYAVSQRTREIGIRVAIGARPGALARMFVRHALVLSIVGIALGLGAAATLTRLMDSLLFGTSPLDGLTYAAVVPLLLVTAALASYLPARRATAIDPVEALKAE
jgi:predicted permease